MTYDTVLLSYDKFRLINLECWILSSVDSWDGFSSFCWWNSQGIVSSREILIEAGRGFVMLVTFVFSVSFIGSGFGPTLANKYPESETRNRKLKT